MQDSCLSSNSYYTLQTLAAFALCLLLAVVPACAQNDSRRDYFPLANGARWQYTGRLSSPNKQFDVPVTISIDGEIIIRGKRYLKYVIKSDLSAIRKEPRRSEEVRYYRTEQGGIYFLLSKDINGDDWLEMPLPLSAGTSWLSGTNEVRAERAGKIEAGGRDYADCLKITYMSAGGVKRTEYYLAPGVGIVRGLYVDVVGPGSSLEITLASYKL